MLAAYLVGGFAVGMGDAFSDVDLHIVVADEAADELAEAWPELIHRIAPTVSIQRFGAMTPNAPRRGPLGGICITRDWLHFDIVIRAAGTVDGHAIEGMVPLLDKAGLLPSSRHHGRIAAVSRFIPMRPSRCSCTCWASDATSQFRPASG